MDNLTHSLFGAALGQIGLKRKTGLAMPTLILAANLPDIDATCVIYGMEHLAMRRGLTHGPLAMLILPLLLWAAMLAFDRWQSRRGKRPEKRLPIHKGWLLFFAYLGCFSHPALDWMNVYGVRLLAPFSQNWFYGDVLFIIDLWIWIGLGLALFLSLRQERRGGKSWRGTAWVGLLGALAYIFGNGVMTGHAEAMAAEKLRVAGYEQAVVVASPPPIQFWKRAIFWRQNNIYGNGSYILGKDVGIDKAVHPTGMDSNRWASQLRDNPEARAFHFWARMPVIMQAEDGQYYLRDQRYMDPMAVGRFQILLGPKPEN